MQQHSHHAGARRRRSASITLVLIASSALMAGCGPQASAGDVAYRDSFRSWDDCRRDYPSGDCARTAGGAYYGPYILGSGGRPIASPNSSGLQQTVLDEETAARIRSGATSVRGGGSTTRSGFGGSGEGASS